MADEVFSVFSSLGGKGKAVISLLRCWSKYCWYLLPREQRQNNP